MSALSTNDIVDALLALLDELARRLEPWPRRCSENTGSTSPAWMSCANG
jgi:hypothetical protein